MTTIAVYSNKGGVGKTAAAVNLAYLAAESGAATLLCDLDAQGSSTFYFRVQPGLKRKARGLTKDNKKVLESVKGTDYPQLDLLPADFSHRKLDLEFADRKNPKARLAKSLEPLTPAYDFLFLDCPPTINLLAENIFVAADLLIVPVIPTTLSLMAHQQLLDFLTEQGYRPQRVFAFFSMVDGRKRMHRELMDEAKAKGLQLLRTTIPYLSHIEQMGVHRAPVATFATSSPATVAYRQLWQETQRLAASRA